MKHRAASIVRRWIAGVNVESHEIVELQALFRPHVGVGYVRHHCPRTGAEVCQIADGEWGRGSEDHRAYRQVVRGAEVNAHGQWRKDEIPKTRIGKPGASVAGPERSRDRA